MPWFLNAPRSTRWTLQCGPITIPTREPALCTSRTVWMEAPHMLSLGWGEETSQLTWFREPHLLDLWLEFAVHCRVSSWDILYLCSTLSSLWVQYLLAASAYLYCESAVTPNQIYLESLNHISNIVSSLIQCLFFYTGMRYLSGLNFLIIM